MLRLVYLEALNALHEAGGELTADPEVLADELLLPADEVARCLPLLDAMARRPGARGGILVEDGKIRNARVSEDLGKTRVWLEEQAEHGKASAASRRTRVGTAQPNAPRTDPQGTFRRPSESVTKAERAPNAPRTLSEPAVAVAVAKPLPEPENNAPPGPPTPVENQVPGEEDVDNGNGARKYREGDALVDGRTVLEVDGNGRPTVVAKAPIAETEAAVKRLVDLGAQVGHRFDRAARRRLRERLMSGESEAQLAAPYERQLAVLQDADAAEEADFDQAMRLLGVRPAGPETA